MSLGMYVEWSSLKTHTLTRYPRIYPFHCFEYEGYTYTVINPSPVESLPGIGIENPEQNLTCKDMRKALWALSRAPEMAYMLKRVSVESAFISRLNFDFHNVPIVKTKGGYILKGDIRTSWQRLEGMFTEITSILDETQRGNPEGNIPWTAYWSYPSDFGYMKVHQTRLSARNAAMRARDACVMLLCRCSMAIALSNVTQSDPPSWIRSLQGRVPSAWVDVLEGSVVADFSPGLRAGAFIDLSGKTAWVHHVPCMIRANLPVYVCWAKRPEYDVARYPFLAPYVPASRNIPRVVEQSESRLFFRWTDQGTNALSSGSFGNNGKTYASIMRHW